ncbi:MAG: response regulator transcription factor [Ruminococcus sp.]|nr:response regulator transcription factor [Ruminococcus sp.]
MPRIFCVEDDIGIRELITCALQSGGYQAESFISGKNFFRRLQEIQPDLVLLDIMLPDEDGISILKHLKVETLTAQIPVIMLSAKSSEIDKVTGLENGADDYITKPFGIMELLSRIKAVLRRSGNSTVNEPHLLEVQGLTVDLNRRTVFYHEMEVSLTYKEFELLSYLVTNHGNAISRDQLLERVWGFSYEGETRTVDAHIKTLRQKLDAAGCQNLIQTIRGYGYKIGG